MYINLVYIVQFAHFRFHVVAYSVLVHMTCLQIPPFLRLYHINLNLHCISPTMHFVHLVGVG